MSDVSLPHCGGCGQPEYGCICPEAKCCDCGRDLTAEEIKFGRDMCFDCYRYSQGRECE
jgi:hypothetical protein